MSEPAQHKNDRKLHRLEVGTVVAGCEILRWENEAARRDEQRYRIRYGCCQREVVLTHAQIMQRRALRSERCRTCGPRWAKGMKGKGTFPERHLQAIREWAIKLRLEGRSLRQVSEETGVSQWTVRSWMVQYENDQLAQEEDENDE